jgi:hypothetical protein
MKGLYFDEIIELGEAKHYFDFINHNEGPGDLRHLNLIWVSWLHRAEDVARRRVPDPYHTGQPRLRHSSEL